MPIIVLKGLQTSTNSILVYGRITRSMNSRTSPTLIVPDSAISYSNCMIYNSASRLQRLIADWTTHLGSIRQMSLTLSKYLIGPNK